MAHANANTANDTNTIDAVEQTMINEHLNANNMNF